MSTLLDKLEKQIDQVYDSQSRKLFEHIIEMGPSAFSKDCPLYKYKDTDLLDRLIAHFQELEEYEKCAKLQKISWRLKGVI